MKTLPLYPSFRLTENSLSKQEWYKSPQGIHSISMSVSELVESSYFVYLLIQDEDVVYVGQTNDIYTRLKEHARHKKFNRVVFLQVPKDCLNMVEEHYINAFKPIYNGSSGTRSHFARHSRERRKNRLHRLVQYEETI